METTVGKTFKYQLLPTPQQEQALEQEVQWQRRDFHHTTAIPLLRRYDTIYLENLRVANMVHSARPAKSISDADWGQFRIILCGKAAYAEH